MTKPYCYANTLWAWYREDASKDLKIMKSSLRDRGHYKQKFYIQILRHLSTLHNVQCDKQSIKLILHPR